MESLVQALESRVLLAGTITPTVDPGPSPAKAFNVGNVSGVTTVKQSLTAKDSADVYRFRVKGKGNVNLTLSRLKANADLALLNSKGKTLANSAKGGIAKETIGRSLNKGTYYARVSGAATGYSLKLQADRNWGSVKDGGERVTVGLVQADGSTRAINPNRETWVVIHGWQSSPNGLAISNLASALDGRTKKDQVLKLDWSEPASESSILGAAGWVPSVSKWVANKLKSWGLTTGEINIAGHSLGGYMTDAIAGNAPGGVNRLVALDPATLSLGDVDFSGVDYADHSRYSLGFIGSTWSSPVAAFTADETIEMDVGPKNSIVSHSNVVDLFAEMVRESYSGSPDPISKVFAVEKLTAKGRPNYKEDAFGGDYEGMLVGTFEGGRWLPKTFTYRDAGTNGNVVLNG